MRGSAVGWQGARSTCSSRGPYSIKWNSMGIPHCNAFWNLQMGSWGPIYMIMLSNSKVGYHGIGKPTDRLFQGFKGLLIEAFSSFIPGCHSNVCEKRMQKTKQDLKWKMIDRFRMTLYFCAAVSLCNKIEMFIVWSGEACQGDSHPSNG